MSDHEEYCSCDHMLLNVDEVSVWELFLLLISNKIGKRKFIDCPKEQEDALEGTLLRRFVIFFSIVAVKLLNFISKPMQSFGSSIEFSLNLWSHYDSLFLLVFNKLQGKTVELDENSAEFSSAVGLTDTRLVMDSAISRRDPRYNSALAIMAAKTAYENKARVQKIVQDCWKMEFLGFFDCWNIDCEEKPMTQSFMFSDKSGDYELIIVSFRGTSPFSADDWSTDVNLSWYHIPPIGKVHAGFSKALGLQKTENKNQGIWPKEIDQQEEEFFAYYKIRQVLRERLSENKNAKFIVTGHSLGGALAVLFSTILSFHKEVEMLERLEGVYTFGQPRVGDDQFCDFMENELGVTRYFRFVYGNDVVPRIPFDDSDFMFKHFGYCYYFDSFYKGQIVKEEPNKNYFSIKWMVPKYLNAVWEIIQSFVLLYAFGSNYREGVLLLGVRTFGLIVPGASAHCPQDYVNLTRLGSPYIFDSLEISNELIENE